MLLQTLVGEANFSFSIPSKEGYLFGRKILLEGANDAQAEAKIRGLTLQGAYCDEATKLPQDFWTMLLSRLRKPGAKLIATTNPDAPGHWLKKDYIDRKEDLEILDIKFVIDDNTTLPADYVENIKKEYTGVFYKRFIDGDWVLAEGVIYPMYEKAIGTAPDDKPSEYCLSIDYGTMNAFGCLLWEKHGSVWYATKGYYYSGRDTGITKTDEEYADEVDKLIEDIMTEREEGVIHFRADYFQKMKTIVDPSAASFITALRKRKRGEIKHSWYNVVPADNDVIDGIRDTATAIEKGLIKIDPSIKAWYTEAQGYVWDESEDTDRPVKIGDHYMDATRYFIRTMRIVDKSRKMA
jgi:PBSX family phage terminase large subunit